MKERSPAALIVFITAADEKEAEKIAERLLAERLAACVNIVGVARSRYWWEGKLEESRETLLIAKTTPACLDGLTAAVKAVHSYQVPEIIAVPIVGGSADYLKWIADEVKPR